MFCSHNEVDLEPYIAIDKDDVDWVVVRCTCCKSMIGKRYKLIDLVDRAIKVKRERRETLPPPQD